MALDENKLEIVTPDTEPGMNFIGVDFDLVMVNRTNERLYGKPVAALLGKKCYREFERREEPCPHCPGRLALATGEPHETETVGLRDDGTRFAARIRAHPVLGPDNKPTGFIEVVEDITEQKRAESLAYIEADLQAALVSAKNAQKALRETLEAALRIEGLDWGCVFLVDRSTGEQDLVFHRGVSPAYLEVLAAVSRGEPNVSAKDIPGTPPLLEVVPIMYRGNLVATLLAGTSVGNEIPPATKAGLRGLGALAGNSIARIWAEQSRGDAVADLEAFISIAPVATWILDLQGRVTMWNKAAEKLFGWQAAEVVGHAPPFGPVHLKPQVAVVTDKEGKPMEVRLMTMPFRDVIGNASTVLVMAENLTETDARPAAARPLGAEDPSVGAAGEGSADLGARVLVLDADEPWGSELADILSGLSYLVTRCRSSPDASVVLADAEAEKRPFALAVVGLMSPKGQSGLDQRAALRGLGLKVPVIMSSDADVHGYEEHGIAGVIKRPYRAEAVDLAVRDALQHRN